MKLKEYKELRELLYEGISVLGTHAEAGSYSVEHRLLVEAYASAIEVLDSIDDLGIRLKYLSPTTNQYRKPKKRKTK